jgi:integrase
MANKTTVALTLDQYKEMIETMKTGGCAFRANERIATALVLEANLGLRIEDILSLRLEDIILDGGTGSTSPRRRQQRKESLLYLLPFTIT